MANKIIFYSCPCPIGGHRISTATKLGKYLHKCITSIGENVRVSTDGIHFHDIPRMYIAFHGLKGKEVKLFPLSIKKESN
jgi:hypothetical protein